MSAEKKTKKRSSITTSRNKIAQAVAVAVCTMPLYAAQAQTAYAQTAPLTQPDSQPRHYRIAAGSLATALRDFASAANILLTFTNAQTDGKTSPGINGDYTSRAALDALLSGTGLQALQLDNGSVVLRAGAVPVADGKEVGNVLPVVAVHEKAQSPEDLPAAYAGGQVARGARLGALGNVDTMDAPFNVTAYTAQTIADQQSATVAAVLRNDPSVRFTTSDGHNAENFKIRGFDVNSSELALNGLYGLLPGTHVPTEFLERVEVFKGPAAMLSGIAPSGAVGGVINLVPKRADDAPLTRVTTSYESQSQKTLAVDLGRRFGDDSRWGIRFNGAATDGETTLDGQKKRENLAAVGIDYHDDRWKLEMDAYTTTQNQSNGSPLMVYFGSLGHVLAPPDLSTNALRGTYARQNSDGFALRGEAKLNRNWSVYAAAGQSHYSYEGYLNGTRIIMLADDGTARGQTYNQAGYSDNAAAEAGIRGSFFTGDIGHQLTLSASLLQAKAGSGNVARSATYMTNLYTPISNPTLAGAHGVVTENADNIFSSLSISDTMLIGERTQLMLGARAQRVRQLMASPVAYDEQAVTPLVGLVFKPWGQSVSLYANYIQGLSPGMTVGTGYTNAGQVLAPYKTRQIETGVKWDAGTFTNTLSLFRIEMPSTITLNPASTLPTLALDGMQRNTGLEWNVFGQVSPSVRLLGGVAYTQATQVRADSADTNGKDVAGVPKWTANLGTEWATPWVPDLTLNARLTYTGAQYIDAANSEQISSWQRWDIGARYVAHVAGKKLTLRGAVENLTDRRYWSGYFNEGYAILGSPRTFKLSAAMDF